MIRSPMPTKYRVILVFLLLMFLAVPAFARLIDLPDPEHEMERVLLAIVIIIIAAKIGADAALRIGQPPVLGELFMGLIIGSLGLFGYHGLEYIREDPAIDVISGVGIVLLLFEVGLESNLKDFMRVGGASALVAVLGVVTPAALGYGAAAWLLPNESVYVHIFIGATLCATSVGITARVFKDLEKLNTTESKIILGAAVLDDVLGLVILAAVQGIVGAAATAGGQVSWETIVSAPLKALAFLTISIAAGLYLSPKIFRAASKLVVRDVLLSISLAVCFLFAFLAGKIGLAPIVGAFAAGLVFDQVHYRDLTLKGEQNVEDLVRPISAFLVPVFFVLMGIRVDLSLIFSSGTLLFAFLLTIAAIIGKQACSLGVFQKGVNKLTIGFGMIPRGEVGLIFAAIGAGIKLDGKPLISPPVFAAIVLMVMVTTFITPPLLRISIGEKKG